MDSATSALPTPMPARRAIRAGAAVGLAAAMLTGCGARWSPEQAYRNWHSPPSGEDRSHVAWVISEEDLLKGESRDEVIRGLGRDGLSVESDRDQIDYSSGCSGRGCYHLVLVLSRDDRVISSHYSET